MQKVLAAGIVLIGLAQSAQACSPAPSCYMTESKDYLKTVCRQDSRRGIDPAVYDDPDSIPRYVKACQQLGFSINIISPGSCREFIQKYPASEGLPEIGGYSPMNGVDALACECRLDPEQTLPAAISKAAKLHPDNESRNWPAIPSSHPSNKREEREGVQFFQWIRGESPRPVIGGKLACTF